MYNKLTSSIDIYTYNNYNNIAHNGQPRDIITYDRQLSHITAQHNNKNTIMLRKAKGSSSRGKRKALERSRSSSAGGSESGSDSAAISHRWMDSCTLLLLVILTLTHIPSARCKRKEMAAGRLENVTQTISKILQGYDIRLRPNFGGEPLHVGMDLTIASFDAISEVNMDYTITMYLNQYWRDERLAFNAYGPYYDDDADDDGVNDVLTLSGDFAEKIWVPDTFFANDKNSFLHDVTERNKLVRLGGDGAVTYGMRFTTTLACMMDLHYYPLDSQNCTVEIESYGYTVSDVVMYWKPTPVRGVMDAELPQFTIIGYGTNDRKERLATGIYQRLSLSFKLQRNIGYFVFQTYLPSILIVMLSWVSFWINHEATSARVALGITTVLTMTTISTGVRSSLPRISYVKAIDIYLVMCFVFVFAALLEYAAVNYTYWGKRAKKKVKKSKDGEGRKTGKGDKSETCSTADDIIELQDVRMSPIPSLRKGNYNSTLGSIGTETVDLAKFPPSFRITRNYGTNRTHLRYRGQKGKPRMLHALKRGASALKATIPKIKDVNIIDKYSRMVFPVSFLAFNLGYWLFYILE